MLSFKLFRSPNRTLAFIIPLVLLCILFLGLQSLFLRSSFLTSYTLLYLRSQPLPNVHQLPPRADWDADGEPSFCTELKRAPLPQTRSCIFNPNTEKCRNPRANLTLFSQFLQDFYLYNWHFKYLSRPGVYVDIAANEATEISNTYFFDRCLRWKGICVEGNHHYFEAIYSWRSCALVPTCVSSKEGSTVKFAMMEGIGGVIDSNFKSTTRVQNPTERIETKRLVYTRMEKVLHRYKVDVIDYMSLDVEGHEMEVLRGFNLNQTVIKVMTVEGSSEGLLAIERYVGGFGYIRHYPPKDVSEKYPNIIEEDAIFLHPTVTFGQPQ